MIDLGKWASDGYVISTPLTNAGEEIDGDYNLNTLRKKGPDGGSGKPN